MILLLSVIIGWSKADSETTSIAVGSVLGPVFITFTLGALVISDLRVLGQSCSRAYKNIVSGLYGK